MEYVPVESPVEYVSMKGTVKAFEQINDLLERSTELVIANDSLLKGAELLQMVQSKSMQALFKKVLNMPAVETPVATTVDTPVSAPVDTHVNAPVDTPVSAAVDVEESNVSESLDIMSLLQKFIQETGQDESSSFSEHFESSSISVKTLAAAPTVAVPDVSTDTPVSVPDQSTRVVDTAVVVSPLDAPVTVSPVDTPVQVQVTEAVPVERPEAGEASIPDASVTIDNIDQPAVSAEEVAAFMESLQKDSARRTEPSTK
jgi:hypothetical protein